MRAAPAGQGQGHRKNAPKGEGEAKPAGIIRKESRAAAARQDAAQDPGWSEEGRKEDSLLEKGQRLQHRRHDHVTPHSRLRVHVSAGAQPQRPSTRFQAYLPSSKAVIRARVDAAAPADSGSHPRSRAATRCW